MRHAIRTSVVSGALIFILAACGALGIKPPETFNEKALAATASINTASQTVFTLLKAQKVTPDESDRYMDRLDGAQSAVNAARELYATNQGEATARLDGLILMLQTLQSELRGRQ